MTLSTLTIELTFPGDALEWLGAVLDAILVLIAIERQSFDDFERTAGTDATKWPSRKADALADGELVAFRHRFH